MHYGEIKNCDVANGIGVRVSLFVSGCTNHCKNCFQKETWDFDYGKVFDEEAQLKIIDMLRPDYIDGITVLGGEPFEPENQRCLYPFLKRIKEECPDKSVWAYSGFTFEELTDELSYCNCETTDELLKFIDVLVDGRFEDEKKDLSLRFRGSSNQRIINMNRTRREKQLILWNENED
ncbi:MAG: anaerobic ribonucleoside-triphosphate reductase activating protein [Anaerovoracaceae bacterium]